LAKALSETEKKMEAIEAKESSFKKQIDELKLQKIDLETELEDQKLLCLDLEDCSKESESMVTTLMKKIAAIEAERDEAQAQVLELEKEKGELLLLTSKLAEASDSRGSELEETTLEMDAYKEKIAALETALAAQQTVCRGLNDTLDRKIEEFHRSALAKQEECNTLRKLVDEGSYAREENSDEKKKRLDLEAKIREISASYENEKESLARTTDLLAEAEGEKKKLELEMELEKNLRGQMEVIQESLLEVVNEKSPCCCDETKEFVALLKD
jgi:chromosome segregation ATPase